MIRAFVFAALLLPLFACSKSSDEEQISQAIAAMANAVETNKPAELTEYLHDDFRANHGEMNAQQVKQLLAIHGLQHQSMSVTILSSKTRIDPVYTDRAETTLSVVTTASAGGLLPNDGSARVVTLQWRKDADWKILSADWQE